MDKKNKSMTRADMISIVANQTGLDKSIVERVLDCFLDTIITELSWNRKIKLSGFGTFENAYYKPREFSSNLSGEMRHLDERVVPKYKPSKTVRDVINNKVQRLLKDEALTK